MADLRKEKLGVMVAFIKGFAVGAGQDMLVNLPDSGHEWPLLR